VKVGIVLPTANHAAQPDPTWNRIKSVAMRADDAGMDSVWLPDHLVFRTSGKPDRGLHEAWGILAAVAAVTTHVELGPLVAATPFRPPALQAKIAATVDEIAGGRLILGLGCGWHEPEFRAFGYPFDHRVGRFEEALAVILPMLRGERVTVRGQWVKVEDAVLVPPSTRRIPILIASSRERMNRLAARHADQWNAAWYGLPDDHWRARLEALHAACDAEGRDRATLELTAGVSIEPGGTDQPRSVPADPSAIADALDAWQAEGVSHVQLQFTTSMDELLERVLDSVNRRRALPARTGSTRIGQSNPVRWATGPRSRSASGVRRARRCAPGPTSHRRC
jgi:alkanesulfonate monooxygenase SsuD/methylene tetrahydromethanopterin reductase-like flavin-dependent oxidoreductase (luciferase family)